MKPVKLQVYDPPMCCSSGVCGPKVDPELVRFSSDLDWLKKQGVEVERFNLSAHPAVFAQQAIVNTALKKEGNKCLPLIVVNGQIVSQGVYPSKQELRQFAGLGKESKNKKVEAPLSTATTADPKDASTSCGPGCDCNKPTGNGKTKIIVSLIVLAAISGIFIYKIVNGRLNAANNITVKESSAFTAPQTAPNIVPGVAVQSANVTELNKSQQIAAAPENKPITNNDTAPGLKKKGQKIGGDLESLSALNKVALNQNAVFVFIPGPNSELADEMTNTAVLAAQRTLKSNNIEIGLYTLPINSADYSILSKQVQAPAILIACKGGGMAAVSGGITEQKLLQAFMASTRVGGGCGPSGCGPSSSGCK